MSQGKDDKTLVEGRRKRGRPPKLSVVPSSPSSPSSGPAPSPSVVVPLARGQGRNVHGLTSKQEAFCQGVGSRGETLATAYRAAYDTENMAATTIHNEAHKLMARPDIAARVNDLVRERQAKTSLDAARIRQHVIERLHLESIDPDSSPAARIRALELLGKLGMVQAFKDAEADTETAQDKAELAATLEARLKALMAKAG